MVHLLAMTLLLLQSASDLASHVTVDGAVDPGALAFLLVSWAFVLGLTFWAFAKILRTQAQRAATPDRADDMSAGERVRPTA